MHRAEIVKRVERLEQAELDDMEEIPVPVQVHLVYPDEKHVTPPLTDEEKAGEKPCIFVEVKDMSKPKPRKDNEDRH